MQKLTRFDVLALVIGAIIGWGSFTLPGTKFLIESGVINTGIGLLIGGSLMVLIQHTYHIMLERHLDSGGEFSYTYQNLGKKHGFLVGWALILCYLSLIPLNATAYTLLIRIIFKDALNFGYLYSIAGYGVYISDIIIVGLVILIFGWVNIKGLKFSSRVQNLFSILLVIIIITMTSYLFLNADMTSLYHGYIQNYHFSIPAILKVVSITPFLFVGFDVIPQVSRQLNFGPKQATRIAIISIMVGVSIYFLLTLIAAIGFMPNELHLTSWAVADTIIQYSGYIGFGIMLLALWAAVTGGINGFMIASSKLVSSLADYKILPKKYDESISNKNAILFVCIISMIAPFFGRQVIIYIVDMTSLLAAVAYGYVSFIGLRFAKTLYSKTLSFLATLVSIGFVVLLLYPSSPAELNNESKMLLVAWVIFGIIVYIRKEKIK